MTATPLKLPGLLLITPEVHLDSRGFFMETYQREKYHELGVDCEFVQDNQSHSVKDVLRGLKFQYNKPTAKLVRVVYGSVFAVGVDIRPDSATFGRWESVTLSAHNKQELFLPFGFAFGFCVTSYEAGVFYKLSAVHNANGSGTIRFDDPDIAIPWPIAHPIVAPDDANAPTLKEWMEQGGNALLRCT